MNLLFRSYRAGLKESSLYDDMHLTVRVFDVAKSCI